MGRLGGHAMGGCPSRRAGTAPFQLRTNGYRQDETASTAPFCVRFVWFPPFESMT